MLGLGGPQLLALLTLTGCSAAATPSTAGETAEASPPSASSPTGSALPPVTASASATEPAAPPKTAGSGSYENPSQTFSVTFPGNWKTRPVREEMVESMPVRRGGADWKGAGGDFNLGAYDFEFSKAESVDCKRGLENVLEGGVFQVCKAVRRSSVTKESVAAVELDLSCPSLGGKGHALVICDDRKRSKGVVHFYTLVGMGDTKHYDDAKTKAFIASFKVK